MSNYFQQLYDIDVADKVKEKNKLNDLPWSSAWAEVKKLFPDATYDISRDPETNRFWFDDGRSGWVEVSVTINGITHSELFPIMDFKNAALSADKITSTEANKAIKRALTKCCADHGLGLYLYEGEELKDDHTRKTKEEKDLKKAHAELTKLCKEKAEAGIDRNAIYEEIKKRNNGNKNPNSVASVEICNEIMKAVSDLNK